MGINPVAAEHIVSDSAGTHDSVGSLFDAVTIGVQ
jgi:hypothetical protein